MKRVIITGIVASIMLMAVVAQADVKNLPVIPVLSDKGVVLTIMGEEPKDLDVIVYDDAKGMQRKIGKVSVFPLEKGESFTFTFSDQSGTHWQLIDHNSSVGLGIVVDCSQSGGCKYARTK